MAERSQSRGRDTGIQSVGRGGAGNFKRSESVSRDRVTREEDGDERGRELSPGRAADTVTHSGRGGAGNVRSPSRDLRAEAAAVARDREVLQAAKEREEHIVRSSGRGGAGNIVGGDQPRANSGSRSRSREPRFSSGRGGAGNIRDDSREPRDLGRLDEEERKAALHHDNGMHSTGRGGLANVTSLPEPHENHSTKPASEPHPNDAHSSGRGGAGNIIHHITAKLANLGPHPRGEERGRTGERENKDVPVTDGHPDAATDSAGNVGLGGPGLVGGPTSGVVSTKLGGTY